MNRPTLIGRLLPALVLLGAWASPGVAGEEGGNALIPGNLDAWKAPRGRWEFVREVHLRADNPKRFEAETGEGAILYNGPTGRTSNLITTEKFGDVALHVEFNVPKGSNSGVKLHGHYEIQIADSWGREQPTASDCGGIYPRALLLPRYHHIDDGYPPRANASRAPGDWQTLDIEFQAPRFDDEGKKTANARFLKVVLNGQVIHDDQELTNPTGNNWRNPEFATGPILLQGDHGPVAFRNIRIRPIEVQDSQEEHASETTQDINKAFVNPDVKQYVERFESESREVYAKRHEIVKAVGLKPGMEIADVGAGTGLFSRLFAEAVGPMGRVYAIDISRPFLEHIAREARKQGLENIATLQSSQKSTNLAVSTVDVVFLSDVYHHFEDHETMLASIRRALRPDGRLVIVEFDRREGKSKPFVLEHIRADRETFLKEIASAGFTQLPIADAPALEENFLAIFRRDGRDVGPDR